MVALLYPLVTPRQDGRRLELVPGPLKAFSAMLFADGALPAAT